MKKILKWLGIVLGSVLLLLGVGALYISMSGIPKYEVKKINLIVEKTPARVDRGRKIVSMLCAECHLNPETGRLTGHHLTDIPDVFGTLYSRNITQDKKYGIGTWTDGEIAVLLRTGVKRDGQYVPPYMVKLPRASDEDILSIISYLRSDDSLVQAVPIQDTDSKPSLLVKFLSHVAFKPFEYPTQPIAQPDVHDKIAYGRYIANSLAKCYACHSADFTKEDEMDPEKSLGYFGGGNEMLDLSGKRIYSANLTMDKETGIGNWTEAQFVHALREGFRPDNTPLRYPMTRKVELSEEECSAVWAYLKTIPLIHNPRKKSDEYILTGNNISAGQRIYYKYSCVSCHGTAGVGTCDLRKAYLKYHSNDSMMVWIKNPSKIIPGTKMPTWEGVIQNDEYVPLCEYVRLLGEQSLKPTASAPAAEAPKEKNDNVPRPTSMR
jgi:cytochrome c2